MRRVVFLLFVLFVLVFNFGCTKKYDEGVMKCMDEGKYDGITDFCQFNDTHNNCEDGVPFFIFSACINSYAKETSIQNSEKAIMICEDAGEIYSTHFSSPTLSKIWKESCINNLESN